MLSKYRRLRSLELSSINIKTSRATQAVIVSACSEGCPEEVQTSVLSGSASRRLRRSETEPCTGAGAAAAAAAVQASPKVTFLDALAQLSSLEDLVLTYDEIFADTAEILTPVFHMMESLKRVDLTRNHI